MDFIWPGNAEAAVTCSFDDGYAATYEATALSLHHRGLCGTYHIITNQIATSFAGLTTADWSQWKGAACLGHEIGSHGSNHTPLAGRLSDVRRLLTNLRATPDRRAYIRQLLTTVHTLYRWQKRALRVPDSRPTRPTKDELASSRDCIDQVIDDPRAESFAYPAGRYDATARQTVAAAGFRSARTLNLGLNRPASDPFALYAVALGPGMPMRHLITWLDRAQAAHAWLIIVFHLVAEENPMDYPYFCSSSDWQRLLDTIQARPVWIAPQRQVVRYLSTIVDESHAGR